MQLCLLSIFILRACFIALLYLTWLSDQFWGNVARYNLTPLPIPLERNLGSNLVPTIASHVCKNLVNVVE